MSDVKFKAGEYVRVKKFDKRPSNWNSKGKMDHLMGEIVKITEVVGNYVEAYDKKYDYTWTFTFDQVEKAKSVIVIYQKENQTIALNKETGEKAVARCHPDDEFDFEIGAKLAFQRLLGSEEDDSMVQSAKAFEKVVNSFTAEGFTRKEAIDITIRIALDSKKDGKQYGSEERTADR